MAEKPFEKSFSHGKRHKLQDEYSSNQSTGSALDESVECEGTHIQSQNQSDTTGTVEEIIPASSGNKAVQSEKEHSFDQDCTKSLIDSENDHGTATGCSADLTLMCQMQDKMCSDLLLQVKYKLQPFLYKRYTSIVHTNAIHVVQMSDQVNLTVQRSLVFYPNGTVELLVHCKPVDVKPYLTNVIPPVNLVSSSYSVNYFVDRCVGVVNNVRQMEVCSGYDDVKFKTVWTRCPFGEVDTNPYHEYRYVETFRSKSCLRLVPSRKWRCSECSKMCRPLKRRAEIACVEEPHPSKARSYFSDEETLKELEEQKRQCDTSNRNTLEMQNRMQELLQWRGVDIENDVSDYLYELLKNGNITQTQSIFLEQQIKASQEKNMRGMRWHPIMVRLALSIHVTLPAAHELLMDTGKIKLPSNQTLLDYSHFKSAEDGFDRIVLESLANHVDTLKRHRKFHVLMADEVYILQSLVFQKSTNSLIGYTKLADIDEEVKLLEHHLVNNTGKFREASATNVLAYMVKGVTEDIKEIVAMFPSNLPSVYQMYMWTWHVIGALERSGIPVIAFVLDGSPRSKELIKVHTPTTKLENGVIFDTLNKAAPSRLVYFITDVPHLIKSIRNCLLNSTAFIQKKGIRLMVRNGKKISWDFIIKLHQMQKTNTLTKSSKLSAKNVHPNSYARMKVQNAAQVLSNTVAQDLENQHWSDASELIQFIRSVDKWFDCLNGAHLDKSHDKRNKNLTAYTTKVLGDNPEDKRFEFLEAFLADLKKWKEEAYSSEVFEGCDGVGSNTPPSKRTLSHVTLEGIEMSSRAIMAAIKFLLGEGVDSINSSVFSLDPFE